MPTDEPLARSALTRPGDIGGLAANVGFLASRFTYRAAKVDHVALAPFSLSIRQHTVLALATVGSGMSQRELGRVVCLDPSNVLRLVDQLADRQLVVRARDDTDRRVTIIRATAEGRRIAAAAEEAVSRAHAELLAPLSDDERDDIGRLLRRLALELDDSPHVGDAAHDQPRPEHDGDHEQGDVGQGEREQAEQHPGDAECGIRHPPVPREPRLGPPRARAGRHARSSQKLH